jgi:hypothetical protein
MVARTEDYTHATKVWRCPWFKGILCRPVPNPQRPSNFFTAETHPDLAPRARLRHRLPRSL